MDNPFVLISSEEKYRNPWMSVREDKVTRPGGKQGIFGVVSMRPGSTILALTEEGDALVTMEFKYGIGAVSVELISGGLDEGETPEEAACRELEEEAGVVPRKIIPLGVLNPFTTVISSPNHMFVAVGVEGDGIQKLDEGEQVAIKKIAFSRLLDMVMRGEVTHGASCVAVLKAQELIRNGVLTVTK